MLCTTSMTLCMISQGLEEVADDATAQLIEGHRGTPGSDSGLSTTSAGNLAYAVPLELMNLEMCLVSLYRQRRVLRPSPSFCHILLVFPLALSFTFC